MRKLTRLRGKLVLATAACMVLATSQNASALAITGIEDTVGIGGVLSGAVLGPSSGITVVGTNYQGTNTASFQQSGTYTGLNLTPSNGSGPKLSMSNGIFLSTGNVNVVGPNVIGDTSESGGSGSSGALSALSLNGGGSGVTNDTNGIDIFFTVAAGVTSISAQFMFATEEFPTENVTDIFGFQVDGVNYAKFSSGELISNTPGNPTNFISNPVGAGRYNIAYNGLTRVFTVVGLLATGGDEVHLLSIGIADTEDTLFDSGVFVSSLQAGTATEGGINPDPNQVPEPASLALVGLGVAGLLAARSRSKA